MDKRERKEKRAIFRQELGACNLGQKVIHTADSHLELEKSHDAQGM